MNSSSMLQKCKWIMLGAASTLVIAACSPKHVTKTPDEFAKTADPNKGLKDYYKNYFKIGCAVGMGSLHSADTNIIIREFNSVTPENDMKMGPIHPSENVYNWKNADEIVAFAQRHNIGVRGHNLCWHNQTAPWMFVGADGKPNTVTKEVLRQRLKEHIYTVVKHFKGKIYAWDVVNEAIDDSNDTTQIYRKTNSPFYNIYGGPEFILDAFRFAHEADPNVKLFYNDYNSEHPVKREKIFKMLKWLKANNAPIDGVGFQAHWKLNDPSPEDLRKAISEVASLGLQIQFTETDITIRLPPVRPAGAPAFGAPPVAGAAPAVRPAPVPDAGYTPEVEAKQIAQYKMAFDIFREYKKFITGVTFWNVSDQYSWLDSRGGGLAGGAAAGQTGPQTVRKAYPLLFDTNRQRKKAYWAVVDF